MNKKTLTILQAQAENGDTIAQCNLADYYLGLNTPEDTRMAVPHIEQAAEAGEPWALFMLGQLYEEGIFLKKSLKKAMAFYAISAHFNYDCAQVSLGIMLANLPGAKKNIPGAIKLYRKAARQNNAQACYNLGLYYQKGHGVPASATRAFAWFKKAGDLGDAEACTIVAEWYENGTGVRKNPEQAKIWQKKALKQH
jgi:TPR repeat protein